MANDPAHNLTEAAPAPRAVVFVGEDASLIQAALAPLGASISLKPEARVAAAMLAVAQSRAAVVIVDLIAHDDARLLLVTALANARQRPRIIVLGRRDRVGELLKLPGVYCVITYPLLPAQIRAAVADRRSKRRNNEAPKEPPAGATHLETPAQQTEPAAEPVPDFKAPEVAERQQAWPGWRLYMLGANRFMAVVSTLYKNVAFVLLASLFSAFCFYGFLIGYFLLASSWGAPVTLSPGHELVAGADRQIADLKVALNTNLQRLAEAKLAAESARQAQAHAKLLADYVKGTVDQEIVTRLEAQKSLRDKIARLTSLSAEFNAHVKDGSMGQALGVLYKKRLIDKRQFQAGTLSLLEAGQRSVSIQSDIADARDQEAQTSRVVDMLMSLRSQLEQGQMSNITAATVDLVLLAKQAFDARSALDETQSQLISAQQSQKNLDDSIAVETSQIAALEAGPFGRARAGRVDVIFVPYGNERNFVPGTPLYSCVLTVLFCHRSGTVGSVLPGESTSVHPFFGKPMRGFYVEAKLTDPSAAAKEIIHAGRPPFFF